MTELIAFASLGRVSTEDRQDPKSSRAWQHYGVPVWVPEVGGPIAGVRCRPIRWCAG
jgi:hypothetical protein